MATEQKPPTLTPPTRVASTSTVSVTIVCNTNSLLVVPASRVQEIRGVPESLPSESSDRAVYWFGDHETATTLSKKTRPL